MINSCSVVLDVCCCEVLPLLSGAEMRMCLLLKRAHLSIQRASRPALPKN